MNEIIEIKSLLDRYYEGESSDADEQHLHEYFTSENVSVELQPYRSIFAYLQHEKEEAKIATTSVANPFSEQLFIQPRRIKWWYVAAAVAACLLGGTFLVREFQPARENLCTGTYVMVNGICYNDLALVRKYATETIDMVTKPIGNGSATDALDFLKEEYQ
jgi:hypothetical protein